MMQFPRQESTLIQFLIHKKTPTNVFYKIKHSTTFFGQSSVQTIQKEIVRNLWS